MRCSSNFAWVLPGLGRVRQPSLGRAWKEIGDWMASDIGLGGGGGVSRCSLSLFASLAQWVGSGPFPIKLYSPWN